MKKKNDIIIIGCDIIGLYAGIKCLELGFNVKIIEKKIYFGNILNNTNNISYEFFNNNHTVFINLLKKFGINTCQIVNNNYNNKLLNYILDKSKNIPQNILISLSFANLCKQLLSNNEYEELYRDLNEDNIFGMITAYDAINMFKYDINNTVKFFKCNDPIQELIKRMLNYFLLKKGKLINNTEITSFTYINKKFIIYGNYSTFSCDYLILSISKDNLLSFKIWNNEQIALLNTVSCTDDNNLKNIYKFFYIYNYINDKDESINFDKNIRDNLLLDLHIIYPLLKKKFKKIYYWNQNVNNIIVREKLRNIYKNNLFICSSSYSKNSMFLNYSLETFENIIPKLINKLL